MKTYLVVPDLHVSFACDLFLKLIIKILKTTPLKGIVNLGDALDFWQISTYDKDPSRKNTIKDDLDEWNKILTQWAGLLPKNSEIHLICGNHEHRLSRYISRHAREIHDLVPSMPQLLHIKERNAAGQVKFTWHPYSKWNSCRLGDCTLFHGFFFNTHTAHTNLLRYRCNTISGHTHRLDFKTDGVHYALSLGHGSDEALTAHSPTPTGWQQALALLNVHDDGTTDVEIIKVNKGQAVVRGQKLKA